MLSWPGSSRADRRTRTHGRADVVGHDRYDAVIKGGPVWSYREMTLFPKPSRRMWTGIVAAVVVVGALVLWFGGPRLYHWHVARSDEKAAAEMATNLGLHLTDEDTIVYAKYYGSFPDSSAYLVVDSNSGARANTLRSDAELTSCGPATTGDLGPLPSEYSPKPSVTWVHCESVLPARGVLSAVWDPAVDQGRRIYIWAGQM